MTELTELQQNIWKDRYALRNENGEVVEQSIEDTWRRVANAIAYGEKESEDFYRILSDFRFVPGGRILAGAGAEAEKTFYNCYVIPVETAARRAIHQMSALDVVTADPGTLPDDAGSDSREAIFDTIGTMVSIMSRGGGVGINWSVLRPRKSYLTRVSGTSSGPVGWMHVASTAVGEVEQGGSRRGAAMFMLDVWHPDVLDFINAKREMGRITNANISVGVTEDFMRAVENGEDWEFIFPDTTDSAYNTLWDGDIRGWLNLGRPVKVYGKMPARDIWNAIAHAAHASGEPGVIFIDRYNDLSTARDIERIICVNPCGEQGLGAYSVCNLGAMNLYAYIDDVGFDWVAFEEDVRVAVRFLDNVIDKTPSFMPETQKRQDTIRRVGLGVMGLADALIALGIRYGSDEGVDFTEKVFRSMKSAAIRESVVISLERGPAPGWDPSMANRPYLREFIEREDEDIPSIRNLFLLTQAPTGTTSLLAGVNSGIEPYFSLKTWREDRTGGKWVYARAVADYIGDEDPSGYDHIVTSSEVTVDEHIAMQAAVQKFVDSSVSKTVNAPKDQTVEETAKAFTLAYEKGLKGIAYYRDGSRDVQVLYHENPNEKISRLEQEVAELKAQLAGGKGAFPLVASIQMMDTFEEGKCPTCGGDVAREEGCMVCHSCGWSACA